MKTLKTLSLFTALLFASQAYASSHREAPLITEDPTADSTDVYMFVSPDDPSTVTILANYIPLQEPAGGPNFHNFSDNVLYEIKIDNTGDAVEDIIYQFRFRKVVGNPNSFLYNLGKIDNLDDPDFNVKQFFDITRVDVASGRRFTTANLKTPPARVGFQSTGDIDEYEALAEEAVQSAFLDGVEHKVFAGVRDEGFFIDLGAVFDLINLSRADLNNPDDQVGKDYTSGFNVHTLALQIPITALTADGDAPSDSLDPNAVIGAWTSASRKKLTILRRRKAPRNLGSFVQVSRLGLPLINELVISLAEKDKFSRTEPKNDVENFGTFILDPELARIANALFGISIPSAPRADMLAVVSFFPGILTSRTDLQPADLLRLNVAIPPVPLGTENRLGVIGGDVAGFPNGRRVGDDVVDILERVVAGGILADEDGDGVGEFNVFPNNALNDGVIQNDVPFLSSFPFLGTPHDGFDRIHQ